MTTNYFSAIIFTKYTDLMPWFEGKYGTQFGSGSTSVGFNQFKQDCARPRDIQLILLVRHDGRHTYCKIKCPVNPLPVCGEFETPTLSTVINFLEMEGWAIKQRLPIYLLK